jgi:hypothetical protein
VRSTTLLFCRALMRISGVVLGMVFLVSLPAGAICRENPHVCAEFFRSDAVFVGTVVSIRDLPDPEDSDTTGGFFYRLKVATVYRGPSQETIEVYTGNDSGRLPLKLHHTHLLFASTIDGRLAIGCGGNSAELAEAGSALRSIQRLLKTMNSATGSDIWGRIRTPDPRARGIPGVRVIAEGEAHTYSVLSDRLGRFRIHVPPGKYAVRIVPPRTVAAHWTITPFELSYYDPKALIMVRGECAEITFMARPKPG